MYRSLWIMQLPLLSSCLLGAMGCHSSTTTIVPDVPPQQMQPAPVPGLSLQQIVEMSRNGSSPNVIMNMISSSHSTFQLTPDEINYLRQQQVDNSVIEYMQRCGAVANGPPPPPTVYTPQAAVAPAYVAPGYVAPVGYYGPPPVYVGVGGWYRPRYGY